MEKLIVKTSIYTFTLTLALLLVFIPRVKMTTDVNGIGSSFEYTYPEYFILLLRFSIIVTFIVVISLVVFKYFKLKKES